ncbi:hypothetical protein JCM18382A_35190 [Bradyrhizobium sp. 17-4]
MIPACGGFAERNRPHGFHAGSISHSITAIAAATIAGRTMGALRASAAGPIVPRADELISHRG